MVHGQLFALFVLPASTNYQLHDYGFGSGGGDDGVSTNYSLYQLSGEQVGQLSLSANYKHGSGLAFAHQANVPAAPTLTSNDYYNKLMLTLNPGSDASDTQYAIAISTDNFTTTNYVQDDNTVGAALGDEDWQTYAQRGGASGFFVIGLAKDTTYTAKVKARHGDFTETGWGPTASAATTNVSISFSISGVASDTSVEGVTTDVISTSTSVPFGELSFNQRREAAQRVTVTTNAVGGYTVLLRQVSALANTTGNTLAAVSGTNAAPATWPTTVYQGAYGYHTADTSLGTGASSRFSTTDTFAQLDTTAREIAYGAAAVANEQTSIVYAIQVGKAQPPGNYSHTIIYTVHGIY